MRTPSGCLTEGQPHWDRLGFVYQEQAICLYQAAAEGITILEYEGKQNHMAEAERRILTSARVVPGILVRGYPSALNRAGRIIGDRDPRGRPEVP